MVEKGGVEVGEVLSILKLVSVCGMVPLNIVSLFEGNVRLGQIIYILWLQVSQHICSMAMRPRHPPANVFHNLASCVLWHVHFLFVEGSPLSPRMNIALCCADPSAKNRSIGFVLFVRVLAVDSEDTAEVWYAQSMTASIDLC